MQLAQLYNKICAEDGAVIQVKFACESLKHALIAALRNQFTVEVFEEAPSIHAFGAGSLFQRTIFVTPYDKKFEKVVPGGTLILVVTKGTRKSIIDVELPPIDQIRHAAMQRLAALGLQCSDDVFQYITHIAKNDPAEIKLMLSLLSTYLVGIGEASITRDLVQYFYPQIEDVKPFKLFNLIIHPPTTPEILWREFDENLSRFGAALPMVAALTTMAMKKYYTALAVETSTPLKSLEEMTGLSRLSTHYVDEDISNLALICCLLLQLTVIRHEIVNRYYDPETVLRNRLMEFIERRLAISPKLI